MISKRTEKITLLKVGGSVLTKKDAESAANMERIRGISEEIALWWNNSKRLILVLGAGSFGHPFAEKYDLNEEVPHKSPIGFSETTASMRKLSIIVAEELIALDVPIFPLQPSCFFLLKEGRIFRGDSSIVLHALDRGLLPLLWGDVVMDTEHTYRILSGDQIMSYFYENLPSDRMLFGTNVDGILAEEGTNHVIERLEDSDFSFIKEVAGGSRCVDVTGGMKGKLLEIWKTQKRPLEALIFNASIEGNISKALMGQKIGTRITLAETAQGDSPSETLS